MLALCHYDKILEKNHFIERKVVIWTIVLEIELSWFHHFGVGQGSMVSCWAMCGEEETGYLHSFPELSLNNWGSPH